MKIFVWRRVGLAIAVVVAVGIVIVVAARVDQRRSRGPILESFTQIRSAIDAERYGEAYRLTSPRYREEFDMDHFRRHEGWRGHVRNDNLEIRPFFGQATVRSRDSQGYWTMGFRRIKGHWYYQGDRGYFRNWL